MLLFTSAAGGGVLASGGIETTYSLSGVTWWRSRWLSNWFIFWC